MNAQPEALARAHIKPGTKFYHGGHGSHHFHDRHELHLPKSHVERLVADGLLDAEPPPAPTAAADSAAEALPAPEASATHETAPAEGEHQA